MFDDEFYKCAYSLCDHKHEADSLSRGAMFVKHVEDKLQLNKFEEPPRIDLIFDNEDLISKLRERGLAIKSFPSVWAKQKVAKIEAEIEGLKNENVSKNRIYESHICGVFMVFQNNEDIKRAAEVFIDSK